MKLNQTYAIWCLCLTGGLFHQCRKVSISWPQGKAESCCGTPAVQTAGDIKSQNILFSSDGTAKIADFGELLRVFGLLQFVCSFQSLPAGRVLRDCRHCFDLTGDQLSLFVAGLACMANHHHENEVATVCGSKIQGPRDPACFDETVTLDASLRQVAGTLGYSDPLYTRSRLSIFPGCYSYCMLLHSYLHVRIFMCTYLVQMSWQDWCDLWI